MKKKIERFGIVKANVMQDPDLSVNAKVVYALLCTFANKQRECHPSPTHLAELLNVSRRTVERGVNELKIKEYVRKDGRIYTVQ